MRGVKAPAQPILPVAATELLDHAAKALGPQRGSGRGEKKLDSEIEALASLGMLESSIPATESLPFARFGVAQLLSAWGYTLVIYPEPEYSVGVPATRLRSAPAMPDRRRCQRAWKADGRPEEFLVAGGLPPETVFHSLWDFPEARGGSWQGDRLSGVGPVIADAGNKGRAQAVWPGIANTCTAVRPRRTPPSTGPESGRWFPQEETDDKSQRTASQGD